MRRGIVAVVLICAFVALAAYYQANVTQHLDYPRENEVMRTMRSMSARTSRYQVSSFQRALSFALKGVQGTYEIVSSEAVQPGDRVTVLGTLQPGHQLRAVTMLTSSPLLSGLVYVRSFFALIVLAALFS